MDKITKPAILFITSVSIVTTVVSVAKLATELYHRHRQKLTSATCAFSIDYLLINTVFLTLVSRHGSISLFHSPHPTKTKPI